MKVFMILLRLRQTNYILIDFDFSFDGTLSEYYNSYLSNLDNITTATNDYYTGIPSFYSIISMTYC